MADDPSRTSDLDLGRALVSQGLITKEQFLECLSIRDRAAAKGEPVRLASLLQEMGYLSGDSAEATIAATVKSRDSAASRTAPASLPPEADAAGRDPANQFGKYVRVSLLGAGGMGEVWKAWDRELRRWVALKFLKGADPAEVARFEREAQTAAALAHPNVAAVYDVGQIAGRPFIALQLIPGRSLAAFPRKNPRTLVRLLRDAAAAVHYAHEQGVIHRDLKPHNLMVEGDPKEESSLRLYVMDFGLAKQTSVESSLSVSGAVLGTPAYMPPEQARGRLRDVDARSDVYSLGATLYELLADRPPFHDANVYEVLRKVVEEDPVPVRKVKPRIDADLETIVLKCLEKDPARRYGSARELAADLDRWLDGAAILAHPPSTGYRLRKFVARRKAILIPSAAAVILGLAFAGWALAGSARKSQKAREELELGRKAEQAGEWKAAHDRLRSALDLEPDLAEAQAALARVDARIRSQEKEQADSGEAMKLLEQARPALDLAFRSLYNKSSDLAQVARRVEEGRRSIEQAVRMAPRLALARHLEGRAWELTGRFDQAEAAWRKAIELDPEFGPACYHLGRLLIARAYIVLQTGTREDFEARLPEAKALTTEAETFVGQARGRSGFEDAVQEQLAAAMIAYLRSDTKEVQRIAGDALKRFASSEGVEEFHWIAGLIAPSRDEAIASFTEALNRRPKFALALFGRGVYLRQRAGEYRKGRTPAERRKELTDALQDLSDAAILLPQVSNVFFQRSMAEDLLEDRAAALRDLDEAQRLDPKNPEVLVNRAIDRKLQRDYPAALTDIDAALRLRPGYAEAHLNRGMVYFDQGNLAEALVNFEEAIRLRPGYGAGYSNRGSVRSRQGNLDGALADYNRAIELSPEIAEAYQGRGTIRGSRGDMAGALEDLDRAIELRPGYARAHQNRALARLKGGDAAGALEDCNEAVRLEPKYPEAYSSRAEIFLGQGRTDDAVRDFQKALEVAPPGWRYRASVEQRLRSLRKDF